MRERLSSFFREWYPIGGRFFPWRQPGVTPFQVLVTEMLLRQTQAGTVAAIWHEFMSRYTTPSSLARASEEELARFLSRLGLQYQRARALRECAWFIEERHQGLVPRDLQGLLEIPHVGLYAAHATLCFAFGERYPVVDANVVRVLGRLFGKGERGDLRRKKVIWELAWDILPREGYVAHNYGLLDFGALVCKTRGPLCEECPLSEGCVYRAGLLLAGNPGLPGHG